MLLKFTAQALITNLGEVLLQTLLLLLFLLFGSPALFSLGAEGYKIAFCLEVLDEVPELAI